MTRRNSLRIVSCETTPFASFVILGCDKFIVDIKQISKLIKEDSLSQLERGYLFLILSFNMFFQILFNSAYMRFL